MLLKISKEKISKIDIINVKGGITATQVYKKYNPDYMINLALYDMATGTNITNLKDEGVASGYLFSDYGIGIKGENDIVWTTKDDETLRDFVAGSPILIKNGEKNIDWGNRYSSYVNGAHNRSVIGFNDKDIILYCSGKEMSLNELVDELKGKCDYAINCDGGGSCHLQYKDKIYKKSLRKNVSWLLIYLKKEVKKMKATLRIGDKTIDINGNKKEYDVAPFIKNNRTFVPVRFLEDLGFQVTWIASEKKIEIIREE